MIFHKRTKKRATKPQVARKLVLAIQSITYMSEDYMGFADSAFSKKDYTT